MIVAEAIYLSHDPAHRVAAAAGGISVVAALLQPFLPLSDTVHRRLYWSLTVAGAVLLSLSVVPHWRAAITMGAVIVAVMVVVAFFNSNYIKINGKVHAALLTDTLSESERIKARTDPTYDPAPDAYAGMTTAKKLWWIVVGLMVLCSVNLYGDVAHPSGSSGWELAGVIGFIALMAIASGYGDASWDYPIARRQYLQLTIAGILTAGIFLVLYVLAYLAGRRWPFRHKQSFEYIHPRFRDPDSTTNRHHKRDDPDQLN